MATQCRQFTNYGCAGFWYLLRLGQCEWRWRRWSQVGGGRDDGWVFTHNLSGTTEINECVPLFLLSRNTQTWLILIHTHRAVSWFISTYPLKFEKFGQVTKAQRGHVLGLYGSCSSHYLLFSLLSVCPPDSCNPSFSPPVMSSFSDLLISANTYWLGSAHASYNISSILDESLSSL